MAPTLLKARATMRHENREHHRAPFTAPVKFFEWNRAQAADAVEISASGIFLKTKTLLAEGSMLTLRLTLPGLKHAFTVLGKVVRTVKGGLLAPAGMGIRFLDLRPADRDVIVAYVSQRA
ncbi:MAG: PilZ domain-containing protein [Myxococcaceae bacterium]|nr:PilZ domain-containing protein [Myxococcaceae bacterium]